MKKNIRQFATIITMMLFSTIGFGQLDFGVKGAVSMSSFTTDLNEISEAAKMGWQLGAFLRLGDKLHLQPEVYFGAKTGQLNYTGMDVNNPTRTGEVSQDITFTTLDIPVLIGYKIIDPPTFNIRLQAGPVASLVINKKFEVSGDGIEPHEPTDDYKDDFKNANWALQFGAGVDFLFLTADLRYELGLSNIYDNSDAAGGIDPGSFKNHLFILSVGFKLL